MQARHLIDWVKSDFFAFDCPVFADERIGREYFLGRQASPDAASAVEVAQVASGLAVVITITAFDSKVFDGAVHVPDRAFHPRMLG